MLMETTFLNGINKKSISLILFICVLILVSSSIVFSQTTADPGPPLIDKPSDSIQSTYNKLLIIPFEDRMYFSNIDQSIGKQSGKNSNEIRQSFKYNLQHSLFVGIKLQTGLGVVSLLSSDNEELKEDLIKTHSSIGYEYQDIPVEEDTTTKSKVSESIENIKEKFKSKKKKEEQEDPATDITDGEITARTGDGKEKFMNTKLKKPEILNYLYGKYETELFLFINQIDIRSAARDQQETWSGTDEREIKIHFAIINNTGKVVLATAFTSRFSSQINGINEIIDKSIADIANQIALKTPKKFTSDAMEEKIESDQIMMEEQNILGQ